MGAYRQTRNLESSLIDFLQDNFDTDWSGVSVEKVFARAYEIALPVVCVGVNSTIHNKVEIGSDSTSRTVSVLINIFCTSDGQREDFADYIVEKLKGGCPYYNYTIASGVVQSKIQDGYIRVTSIETSKINFDTNPSNIDPVDRYRGLIELEIKTGHVEV